MLMLQTVLQTFSLHQCNQQEFLSVEGSFFFLNIGLLLNQLSTHFKAHF